MSNKTFAIIPCLTSLIKPVYNKKKVISFDINNKPNKPIPENACKSHVAISHMNHHL